MKSRNLSKLKGNISKWNKRNLKNPFTKEDLLQRHSLADKIAFKKIQPYFQLRLSANDTSKNVLS